MEEKKIMHAKSMPHYTPIQGLSTIFKWNLVCPGKFVNFVKSDLVLLEDWKLKNTQN